MTNFDFKANYIIIVIIFLNLFLFYKNFVIHSFHNVPQFIIQKIISQFLLLLYVLGRIFLYYSSFYKYLLAIDFIFKIKIKIKFIIHYNIH